MASILRTGSKTACIPFSSFFLFFSLTLPLLYVFNDDEVDEILEF